MQGLHSLFCRLTLMRLVGGWQRSFFVQATSARFRKSLGKTSVAWLHSHLPHDHFHMKGRLTATDDTDHIVAVEVGQNFV